MRWEIEIPETTMREIEDRIHKALWQTANDMKNKAKELSPVLTGHLRRNIFADVKDNTMIIFTVGVDYAQYVEYGTPRMIAAHGEHDPEHPVTSWEALRKRGGINQQMPFMRPAIHRGLHDYLWNRLKEEFK